MQFHFVVESLVIDLCLTDFETLFCLSELTIVVIHNLAACYVNLLSCLIIIVSFECLRRPVMHNP